VNALVSDPGEIRTATRAERVARAVLKAEIEAEAVRELDALQRDDEAIRRVRDAIGWIW
jgi:hypothetical protein